MWRKNRKWRHLDLKLKISYSNRIQASAINKCLANSASKLVHPISKFLFTNWQTKRQTNWNENITILKIFGGKYILTERCESMCKILYGAYLILFGPTPELFGPVDQVILYHLITKSSLLPEICFYKRYMATYSQL